MPARVTIDQHRIAHVDGRPFFLIGARHMPEGATPETLRDAGFNAYRTLAFGHEVSPAEEVPRDLEGIYFWSYLYDRADFTKSPDHERQLRETVKKLRKHPALLCYENLNEPTLQHRSDRFKAEPEDLARGTAILRELDPDHPVWLAHCCRSTVETLRRFNASMDIVGCNPYPVYVPGMRQHMGVRPDGKMLDCPDQSIHAVGKYTEKMMRVADDKLAVWMLIQALPNEHWYCDIHTPELAGQGIEKSKVLYPTYQEMRFMVFDAVVHGATGVALSMVRTPTQGAVWGDINRLVGELRAMHDALCAPRVADPVEVFYTDIGFTIWDGVCALAGRLGDTICLFAVNTQFDPMEVSLRLPAFADATQAVVVHEGREIRVEKAAIRDRFDPYAVHVYKVKMTR